MPEVARYYTSPLSEEATAQAAHDLFGDAAYALSSALFSTAPLHAGSGFEYTDRLVYSIVTSDAESGNTGFANTLNIGYTNGGARFTLQETSSPVGTGGDYMMAAGVYDVFTTDPVQCTGTISPRQQLATHLNDEFTFIINSWYHAGFEDANAYADITLRLCAYDAFAKESSLDAACSAPEDFADAAVVRVQVAPAPITTWSVMTVPAATPLEGDVDTALGSLSFTFTMPTEKSSNLYRWGPLVVRDQGYQVHGGLSTDTARIGYTNVTFECVDPITESFDAGTYEWTFSGEPTVTQISPVTQVSVVAPAPSPSRLTHGADHVGAVQVHAAGAQHPAAGAHLLHEHHRPGARRRRRHHWYLHLQRAHGGPHRGAAHCGWHRGRDGPG